MKEIFINNKIIIFRVFGALLLLVGFAVYFWASPKKVLSQNEIAAANIARIEAHVSGASVASPKASKPDTSKFLEKLKSTQEKQIRFLTVVAMIFGIGFLGYSFIKPKSDSER
jgi:uncharacterized protein YjeT (DUF2065 family)